MTTDTNREAWLLAAVEQLRPLFSDLGHEIPTVRVSVGFPGGGSARKRIGECWVPGAANDKVGQIFVSPLLESPVQVLATLAHELVHAINHAAGQAGHGRCFAKIAKRLGLEGRMTATHAGKQLQAKLDTISRELNNYPHAALTLGAGQIKAKQSTRMLKVTCPECGYTLRTTRQWLDVGVPTCPCGTEMEEAS